MTRILDSALAAGLIIALAGCVTPKPTASEAVAGQACAADLAAYLVSDGGRWRIAGEREDGSTYASTMTFSNPGAVLSGTYGGHRHPIQSARVKGDTVSFEFESEYRKGRKGMRTISASLSCRENGQLAGYLTGPGSSGSGDFQDRVIATRAK